MKTQRHVLFFFVGEFTHLAFANAIEPLRLANRMSDETLYTWAFMSADGKEATSSNGARMLMDHSASDVTQFDHFFLITGNDLRAHIDKPLLAVLRRARHQGASIAAFCSGAFALAEAGFLNQREVALHWEFHAPFREHFPEVHLSNAVFVKEGPILTAAGGQAVADLVLSLIREQQGVELAEMVSDQMLYSTVRTEAAQQRVSFQARFGIRCEKLSRAIRVMEADLERIDTMGEVAERAGMSNRQLERLFKRYLNTTPKKYLISLRLGRARQLLQETELSVTEVTMACGFENPSHFSRLYRQAYGVSPREQRAI